MQLQPAHFAAAPLASGSLPRRPDVRVLNGVIPLFFIGRNKHGFWLAREARGRIGGMFFLRRSAYRFAQECLRLCMYGSLRPEHYPRIAERLRSADSAPVKKPATLRG